MLEQPLHLVNLLLPNQNHGGGEVGRIVELDEGVDCRDLVEQGSTEGLPFWHKTCLVMMIKHPINQSPINQSINQLPNQSIIQSINHPINQSPNQLIIQSINQSNNQSINQSINQGRLQSCNFLDSNTI